MKTLTYCRGFPSCVMLLWNMLSLKTPLTKFRRVAHSVDVLLAQHHASCCSACLWNALYVRLRAIWCIRGRAFLWKLLLVSIYTFAMMLKNNQVGLQGCCKKTRPNKTHPGFFWKIPLEKNNKTNQKTHSLLFLWKIYCEVKNKISRTLVQLTVI